MNIKVRTVEILKAFTEASLAETDRFLALMNEEISSGTVRIPKAAADDIVAKVDAHAEWCRAKLQALGG